MRYFTILWLTNSLVPKAPFLFGVVQKHSNQKILCSAGLLNYKWVITTPNCTEEYHHEPDYYTVGKDNLTIHE